MKKNTEYTIRSISQFFAAISQFFRSNVFHMLPLIFYESSIVFGFRNKILMDPFLFMNHHCFFLSTSCSPEGAPWNRAGLLSVIRRGILLELWWAWPRDEHSYNHIIHMCLEVVDIDQTNIHMILHIISCYLMIPHLQVQFRSTWYVPKDKLYGHTQVNPGFPSMFQSSPQSCHIKRQSFDFELNLKIQPTSN